MEERKEGKEKGMEKEKKEDTVENRVGYEIIVMGKMIFKRKKWEC